ncbi:MAG: tRNA (adenosine(37)-N6)-threonylcarbamoyltransferase complex transferase subunit TsaD [Peptococcaceae bacterium]|nr:tRNA (adenosine(37)-N6)-threonylcarbamoyltransferase complex transferase subunit TsaD [Peptococcaceae bacterium]
MKKLNSVIMAIESSCDETACAIIKDGTEICANVVSTQIKIHEKFGGVVPEIASRKHLEYIDVVIEEALDEAGLGFADLDAIAVTMGPGLIGALLVGLSTAKGLAYSIKKPLIGVHHIEGHIYANFLAHPEIALPCICLVVSGGHTNIVKITEHGHYEILGQTVDDAAGEAYDKVARAIGLGYPGGPKIDRLAKEGNPKAIDFPRAQLDQPLNFSFSGLKSAVLNYLNQMQMKNAPVNDADVAASFQEAVVDVLVGHTIQAMEENGIQTLLLAGGVSANSHLRDRFDAICKEKGFAIYYPPLSLCTDNAAMIGAAAAYKFDRNEFSDYSLNAVAQLPFSEYVTTMKH